MCIQSLVVCSKVSIQNEKKTTNIYTREPHERRLTILFAKIRVNSYAHLKLLPRTSFPPLMGSFKILHRLFFFLLRIKPARILGVVCCTCRIAIYHPLNSRRAFFAQSISTPKDFCRRRQVFFLRLCHLIVTPARAEAALRFIVSHIFMGKTITTFFSTEQHFAAGRNKKSIPFFTNTNTPLHYWLGYFTPTHPHTYTRICQLL